jgi:predicted alpha/beta-fold hydrolase
MESRNQAESKAVPPSNAVLLYATPAPAWWLPGPHLPTIFGKVCRSIDLPPTTRERWPTADGDVLSVERLRGSSDAPRIVLFHGLEGGTHSTYARGILHEARDRGWWADLVLWRTCDDRPVNDTRRAYHSGASDDAEAAIARVLSEDADRPTFLFGVSLGGNVLLKWLGERGDAVPPAVCGAVAVSVPFDLAAASRRIERGFSKLYGRVFLKSLKAKTFAKLERFPGMVDRATVSRVRTLWEFDDVVTAPIHGFASAADYYERCSSIAFLDRIRLRTLLVSAQNDPFLPREVLDKVRAIARANSRLHCDFPAQGGHVGFISGSLPWRPVYWMERFTLDWLVGGLTLKSELIEPERSHVIGQ